MVDSDHGCRFRQVRARRHGFGRRAAFALAAVFAAGAASAQDIAGRWREVCAACHGPAGQSKVANVPSLGGQPMLFTAIQLYLFREGRRTGTPLGDAMTEVAKQINDSELRSFSEFAATLPPPQPPEGPVDPARMRRGAELADKRRCQVCHNADYSGREQMARLANQREDYLVMALGQYRRGRRVGAQAAMLEAVAGLDDAQIADLAYMLAHWPKSPGRNE
jgi:cytochrome c553